MVWQRRLAMTIVAVLTVCVAALGLASSHPQSLTKHPAAEVQAEGSWPCSGTDTFCSYPMQHCCPGPDMKCCGTKTSGVPEVAYCCGQGYDCGDNRSGCVKQDVVICPNHKDVCPEGSTCCERKQQGVYGCCPQADAVCCGQDQDYQRCCSTGYMCAQGFGHCKPF